MHIHCKMITTIRLINIYSITRYLFIFIIFFLWETLKNYSLSKFKVCSAGLLTIGTRMYIRFPRTYSSCLEVCTNKLLFISNSSQLLVTAILPSDFLNSNFYG